MKSASSHGSSVECTKVSANRSRSQHSSIDVNRFMKLHNRQRLKNMVAGVTTSTFKREEEEKKKTLRFGTLRSGPGEGGCERRLIDSVLHFLNFNMKKYQNAKSYEQLL